MVKSETILILNVPVLLVIVNEPVLAVKSDTVALPPVVDQYNTVPFATFAVFAVKTPEEPSFIVAGTDENE